MKEMNIHGMYGVEWKSSSVTFVRRMPRASRAVSPRRRVGLRRPVGHRRSLPVANPRDGRVRFHRWSRVHNPRAFRVVSHFLNPRVFQVVGLRLNPRASRARNHLVGLQVNPV